MSDQSRLLDQDLPRIEMYAPAFRSRVHARRRAAALARHNEANKARVTQMKQDRDEAWANAHEARLAAVRMIADAKTAVEHMLQGGSREDAEALLSPKPLGLDILRDVAVKHGLTVGILRGPSRSRHIVAVRHEAIAAVHVARPDLSLPALGRIFNRDHTSILFALRKLGVR